MKTLLTTKTISTTLRLFCILTLAAASGGCGLADLFSDSPSSPSEVRSYLGEWQGPEVSSYPTTQSCGNVQWKVTSQAGREATGDFLATCSGGNTLAGTLTASHSATIIPWSSAGTATQGPTSCPYTLTGTGTFLGTSNILVTFTGTSCLGPLSGSETITR